MHEGSPIDQGKIIERLVQARADRGLTQAYVAERMGTTQPYIARLESATSDPRLSTILRYAAIVAGAALLATILADLDTQGKGKRSSR
jgi:predicted transcriptional regulator